MAFSAAVAALDRGRATPTCCTSTTGTPAWRWRHLAERPPTMLTIHTLAYQGRTNPGWLKTLPHHVAEFEQWGDCNPLLGGIRLADVVVAVSPNYAAEITTPHGRVRPRRTAPRHGATGWSASSTASTRRSGIRRPTATCRRRTRRPTWRQGRVRAKLLDDARAGRRGRATADDGHPARRPEGRRPGAAADAVPAPPRGHADRARRRRSGARRRAQLRRRPRIRIRLRSCVATTRRWPTSSSPVPTCS